MKIVLSLLFVLLTATVQAQAEDAFPRGRVAAGSEDPAMLPDTANQAGHLNLGYDPSQQTATCERCEHRNKALLSNNRGVLNAANQNSVLAPSTGNAVDTGN